MMWAFLLMDASCPPVYVSYLTVLEPNMEAFAPVVEALRDE
ncbi:hypothetical protein ACFY1B_01050 [Streptomyces mirabilis]